MSPLILFSQAGQCDTDLAEPAGHPYGYRRRGELCEGVYVRQVSSSGLVLASFTSSIDDYDVNSNQDLIVEWRPPSAAEVRLRARTLDRRLYYRMDALRQKDVRSLTWPTSLLGALKIQRVNLGVLGWIPAAAGSTAKDMYLPVRVRRPSDEGSPGKRIYQVVLLPGLELSEVYVSLSSKGVPIREGEPLGYGYYPADRSVAFPIRYPASTGVYYLEIGASLKRGGSVTLPVWFYHSE